VGAGVFKSALAMMSDSLRNYLWWRRQSKKPRYCLQTKALKKEIQAVSVAAKTTPLSLLSVALFNLSVPKNKC